MEILQRIRLLTKELFIQLELRGHLLKIEWLQEKNRIQQIICVAFIGFALLLCCLLMLGFFVIVAAWTSEYRLLSIAMVFGFYLFCLVLCCIKLNALAAKGADSFAVTREELAADIALIRSQL